MIVWSGSKPCVEDICKKKYQHNRRLFTLVEPNKRCAYLFAAYDAYWHLGQWRNSSVQHCVLPASRWNRSCVLPPSSLHQPVQ